MANNTGIKTGGRKAGTCNILTKEMRAILKSIISKELEILPETIKKMNPEKRLDILLKLLPYVLPKVEAISPGAGEPLSFDY